MAARAVAAIRSGRFAGAREKSFWFEYTGWRCRASSWPRRPLERGFDEFYGFLHEGRFYAPPPYRGVVSFLRRKNLPEGAGPRWIDGDIVWTSHMGDDEPPYDADNPILRGRTQRTSGRPIIPMDGAGEAFFT